MEESRIMIWKIVTVLSFALFVQSEKEAISEQKVVIHHQKSDYIGSLAYNEPNKSGDEDKSERSYTSYEFSYKVNDPETHDIKGQHEKGSEDEVVGNYWLIEPNGRKRTVNYQANDDKGFNAQIDYTESFKEKKTNDDVEISQSREQSNVKKNNDEDNKNNADDAIQNPIDSSNADEDISDQSPLDEKNLDNQNKLDNQVDEANYISNIENDNVDRTDRENLGQGNHKAHVTSNLVNNKRENNGRNLSKSRGRNPEKAKREKIKRNKNQNQIPSRNGNESNKHNRDEQRNVKHIKLENIKLNENNNRIVNKRLKTNRNRNKNFNNPENNSNGGIENKIKSNLEQNHRIQNGIKKEENNYNTPQNVLGIDNYFLLPNLEPSEGVIQREKKSDTVTETYAHSIRIYHPKNISPTPKEHLNY